MSDWSRDIAQPGLARLTGGQKVESSNLSIPTIFMPKFRESELKLGFPFFFVHCCRFSPKVADSRRKCHISATFFATQFSRRQVTRKNLIFFHLDDSDSFRRKESEEPEISVSCRIIPISSGGNSLVGGASLVVLSFPHR